MKVVSSEVLRVSIAGRAARDAVGWIARDETGCEGVGEAAPIAGWSADGETIAAVTSALDAVRDRIGEIEEGCPAIESISRALAPHGGLLEACPTAMFAVETALLDLLARRRGEDVTSCLAGSAGVSERDLGVETSALLVGALDLDEQAFVARGMEAIARGFRVIKVKLRAADDATLEREIEAIAALRRAAPDFELRLDPNGRWSVEEARGRLARLAALEPAFVEQPVPAGALAELGPSAVPWAADEALAVAGGAERLSREDGCAAFVIKPAALGVRRALALAEKARERGLDVVVTHFLDGAVGLAAACEIALALACGGFELRACGLAPHEGLRGLPRALLPHHRGPARVQRTGLTGLGLPRREALRSAGGA